MASAVRIKTPSSAAELAAVKALFEEYAGTLGFDLGFQNYDEEMSRFPRAYRAVLMAEVEGAAAGAVALKAFGAADCEMKRLYCRPAYRALGIGRRLAEAIIAEARARGFARMLLDTMPQMRPAQALYRRLGFEEIAPYYNNPHKGVLFMALDL